MDLTSLVTVVAALPGGANIALYAPAVFGIAAILAAILPQAPEGSPWVPARKFLDLLAFNFKNAANAPTAQKGA
jgi:hypothetical protein